MTDDIFGTGKIWAILTGALLITIVCVLIAGSCGCTGSLERSRAHLPEMGDVAYCRRLDDRAATWGAVGKGSVVLSSGAGLTTLPVDPAEKTLRLSLAGASLGFAAIAVSALFASDAAAESWARECSRLMPAALQVPRGEE